MGSTDLGASSLTDFPEDVQVCILSFLSPVDLQSLAATCKRFLALYEEQSLWSSMCQRRWGSKTLVGMWACCNLLPYRRLYGILHQYERLIGFWRHVDQCGGNGLVFFEWGSNCITGFRVMPMQNAGYAVRKKSFFCVRISREGKVVSYVEPTADGHGGLGLAETATSGGDGDDLAVKVGVGFIGDSHVVLEEEADCDCSGNGNPFLFNSSPPEQIYQYFANRMSRRQRRREKDKPKRWETQHFVKILNCSPKPARPLQGIWKGISSDMSLKFYLVSYDDVGGISCRNIGDSSLVFWTPISSQFIDAPFSPEEDQLYKFRVHLPPEDPSLSSSEKNGAVSHMLCINSSFDLAGTGTGPGRIWLYGNGTFGFGFLRGNYVIDLKYIAQNGCILDAI